MRRQSFLSKLKKEGKLELVKPSNEICESYIKKANDCLKSAKLLAQNNLYENSISMSYYVMYDVLTALLFKVGIKCENHSGAIALLRKLFKNGDLFRMISFAKRERIDKQYYVASAGLIEKAAQDMLTNAESFLVEVRLVITMLTNAEIENLRELFKSGGIL